ncbi:MAG: DUF1540 domain-containing protein [Oscillospiraceae bacterium]|jgi:hypothetical protein|nr:DUF1540 domain-containing protein [Oscillospiraceae bacterium]
MSNQFDYQSYASSSGGTDNSEKLDGVCCDVKSCKYHAPGDICQAQNIKVEAPDASKKIETYCGTYSPQSNEGYQSF